jgi:hypothetical protein
VVLVARITGIIAAIIWFIGAPLFVLAGVPFPSDAQYVVLGAIAVLLGLALVPVALTIAEAIASRMKLFIRVSGLVVCIGLAASGVALLLALQGWLGEGVARAIADGIVVVFVAVFVWITVASIALRGPSPIERSIFWLGLLTGTSCLVPVLASIVFFYFARDFVFTNATVLPVFLVDLFVWVSLPAWLTAVVIDLSKNPAT